MKTLNFKTNHYSYLDAIKDILITTKPKFFKYKDVCDKKYRIILVSNLRHYTKMREAKELYNLDIDEFFINGVHYCDYEALCKLMNYMKEIGKVCTDEEREFLKTQINSEIFKETCNVHQALTYLKVALFDKTPIKEFLFKTGLNRGRLEEISDDDACDIWNKILYGFHKNLSADEIYLLAFKRIVPENLKDEVITENEVVLLPTIVAEKLYVLRNKNIHENVEAFWKMGVNDKDILMKICDMYGNDINIDVFLTLNKETRFEYRYRDGYVDFFNTLFTSAIRKKLSVDEICDCIKYTTIKKKKAMYIDIKKINKISANKHPMIDFENILK